MSPVRIDDRNIFTALTVGSWIFLLIMTLAGLAFGAPRFAAGVLAGGVVAMANHYWLRAVMRRALLLPVANAGRFALFRYLLRLAVIAGIAYLLIVHWGIDIPGFIVGLSVLVLVLTALTIYMLILKGG